MVALPSSKHSGLAFVVDRGDADVTSGGPNRSGPEAIVYLSRQSKSIEVAREASHLLMSTAMAGISKSVYTLSKPALWAETGLLATCA